MIDKYPTEWETNHTTENREQHRLIVGPQVKQGFFFPKAEPCEQCSQPMYRIVREHKRTTWDKEGKKYVTTWHSGTHQIYCINCGYEYRERTSMDY